MNDYMKTPLWDSSLPLEERLDYLISNMTIDEKLSCFATGTPALPRFGIGVQFIGSEAAHGVEARHDQGVVSDPEPTTSFPQPIGMSASWDPDLVRDAGEVTGKEARVLFQRNPIGGLCRFAPTVDMERDPRWGRTEEGYGEDPYLTGEMASAYVSGMQGNDPEHLLIAATLKHFMANNVEDGRGIKSSSVDAGNRFNYYYEPFRRVIEKTNVRSVMTAYNALNGVTEIMDHRMNELLRDKWGFNGHVVSDGGAMTMVADVRHETQSHADSIALAVKAGVDCMTDGDAKLIEEAAREAYNRGLLSEENIDTALRHSFSTKLRLGLYDAIETNPWNHVEDSVLNSEEHRKISLSLARESVVLLKNDGILPIQENKKICLAGPLCDHWLRDWYGGEPYYQTTVLDGIRHMTGEEPAMERGLDLILLCTSGLVSNDGFKENNVFYVSINDAGLLEMTSDREKAEPFFIQDWGDNSITFYVPRIKKYVCVHDDGSLSADQKVPFGWFVHECFHWGKDVKHSENEDTLSVWYGSKLTVRKDGLLAVEHTTDEGNIGVPQTDKTEEKESDEDEAPVKFRTEIIKNGKEAAVQLAEKSDIAVLVLGNCPVINGKEDADRPSILFPKEQRDLAMSVFKANPNTVLVLLANYPYAIDWEQENLPAILLSATGSQDMGDALADVLFGKYSPAGCLNMTWYKEDTVLPDKDDYDIRKTKRTYRFYDKEPLYPFGYGLTYSQFEFKNLNVKICLQEEKNDNLLSVSVDIINKGNYVSDKVVQIYMSEPSGRVQKPIRRLIAFKRIKNVIPMETRTVSFEISREEFRFYDVTCGKFIVEEGYYLIEAGTSSGNIFQKREIYIQGDSVNSREKNHFISVDYWDDYENLILGKGPDTGKPGGCESCSAYCAISSMPSWATYKNINAVGEKISLELVLSAEKGGKLRIESGGLEVASWICYKMNCKDSFETVTVSVIPRGEDLTIYLEGNIRFAGFTIKV